MIRILLIILSLFIFSCDSGDNPCPSGYYDCEGECDGPALEDECGECNGNGVIPEGVCDCDENPIGSSLWDNICDQYLDYEECENYGCQSICGDVECPYISVEGNLNNEDNFTDCVTPSNSCYCGDTGFNQRGFSCSGECIAVGDNLDNDGEDCFGVCAGYGWESDCGCVDIDNSGDECDDCLGVPNGDAIEDCAGVCEGDAIYDCTYDPDDEFTWQSSCGGSAVINECGECNADSVGNISTGCDLPENGNYLYLLHDQDGNVRVLYRSDSDIAGIQFSLNEDASSVSISNINYIAPTPSDAIAAGLDLSAGEDNIILGYSIEGNTMGAGCGTLLILEGENIKEIQMGNNEIFAFSTPTAEYIEFNYCAGE